MKNFIKTFFCLFAACLVIGISFGNAAGISFKVVEKSQQKTTHETALQKPVKAPTQEESNSYTQAIYFQAGQSIQVNIPIINILNNALYKLLARSSVFYQPTKEIYFFLRFPVHILITCIAPPNAP